MFVQHALEQDIPENVEASDINTIDRSGWYGADENGPIPSAELHQVIVPRSSIVLDTNQLYALQVYVNPLSHSDNYAIDLYQSARSYLSQMFNID